VIDDSYRPVRRRLHDMQPAPGGMRAAYSRGTVSGVQKGLLVGAANGKVGRLCGELNGKYRYQTVSANVRRRENSSGFRETSLCERTALLPSPEGDGTCADEHMENPKCRHCFFCQIRNTSDKMGVCRHRSVDAQVLPLQPPFQTVWGGVDLDADFCWQGIDRATGSPFFDRNRLFPKESATQGS